MLPTAVPHKKPEERRRHGTYTHPHYKTSPCLIKQTFLRGAFHYTPRSLKATALAFIAHEAPQKKKDMANPILSSKNISGKTPAPFSGRALDHRYRRLEPTVATAHRVPPASRERVPLRHPALQHASAQNSTVCSPDTRKRCERATAIPRTMHVGQQPAVSPLHLPLLDALLHIAQKGTHELAQMAAMAPATKHKTNKTSTHADVSSANERGKNEASLAQRTTVCECASVCLYSCALQNLLGSFKNALHVTHAHDFRSTRHQGVRCYGQARLDLPGAQPHHRACTVRHKRSLPDFVAVRYYRTIQTTPAKSCLLHPTFGLSQCCESCTSRDHRSKDIRSKEHRHIRPQPSNIKKDRCLECTMLGASSLGRTPREPQPKYIKSRIRFTRAVSGACVH